MDRKSETKQIAGHLTADDWKLRKKQLEDSPTEDNWAQAYEDFFRQRLGLRYLEPISLLQREGSFQGEGFSIVTIQCALIEFLEATRQGKNYRFVQNASQLGEHEYNRSGALFSYFLSRNSPFSDYFDDESATEFYKSVRCGLLHEASTKNGWKIWASGTKPVNIKNRTMFRDAFQRALLEYIENYGRELLTDANLQAAFIRKFDHLADT
ncbi:hypothetical protein AB838_07470 [Rhodobacteraceae bacterium (ex Bugula neritina AB1)]|nr:hypothetical protein AB838_07470 [Rhodobacteraceae bacterium (ex Bugula neritina AB1)]